MNDFFIQAQPCACTGDIHSQDRDSTAMVSLGRIFHTESPVMVSFEEYTSSYEAFHSAVHLSAVLLVFQRIALVVFLLSFCESDIKFCKTLVVDI